MRNNYFFGIIFFILLLAMFYKFQEHPEERTLFPEVEIIHTNIEQIQVLNITSNDNKVIDELKNIEIFSSYFRGINSNKINNDVNADDEKPVYHIYIVNTGRHSNPPISVYKDSIVYQGKKRYMTSEESSSLFQLIDETRK
ncbi:hypothetical protein [Psychrobacillus sp. FSL K6-1464]|uniref:hypothetical protein n=1 Tax=Psychrobacillus sp. FSL K6-1464 TaxID=2921545 RepID=UPI0030F4D627